MSRWDISCTAAARKTAAALSISPRNSIEEKNAAAAGDSKKKPFCISEIKTTHFTPDPIVFHNDILLFPSGNYYRKLLCKQKILFFWKNLLDNFRIILYYDKAVAREHSSAG